MELENTDTVEVIEDIPEIIEDTVDAPIEEIPAEEVTEEVTEETSPEATEEVTEAVVEPPVFDLTSPTLIDDAKAVLEKYDLPVDMQAAVDALLAKQADDPIAEYADYGDADAIKTLLDRQNLLDSDRVEGNSYRPNTDKFIESLAPDRQEWLAHDLLSQPSKQYQGLSKFEETIVNTYGTEGEPVAVVLDKYKQFVTAMQTGIITADIPSFIPTHLQEAFFKLSTATRNELSFLDPEIESESIAEKIKELELIQKGLNSDKQTALNTQQQKLQAEQVFSQTVQEKQVAFYDALRTQFAQDMVKEVTFSDDPKMQTLLVNQQVALLTQAFEEGSAGDFARNTLKEAGITFDMAKAESLMKAVEQAAVTLTSHEKAVNAQGQPLNPIEINKARSQFAKAGLAWQAFATDILKQEAALTSTGKKEDVQKAVEKQKIAVKARVTPNGTPTPAKKTEILPPYGTPQWDAYWANKTLDEQAKRVRQYAS